MLPSDSAQSICKYLSVWRHKQIKYCQTGIKDKEFEPILYKDYAHNFCSSFVNRYEEMNLIDICLFKLMEQIQHIYENKVKLDYADGEVWVWLDNYIHGKKPTCIEFIKECDNED